jgi:CheY-like chemotaxis protein
MIPATLRQPKPGGGALILIVEDDPDTRFVYRLMLEDHGYTVASAESGHEGLRLAREQGPRAIVMDISIPGLDGWEVTERLRSVPETAAIPVIVVTACAFPEDRLRAESLGCEGFLTKPCAPQRVLAEVRRHLPA